MYILLQKSSTKSKLSYIFIIICRYLTIRLRFKVTFLNKCTNVHDLIFENSISLSSGKPFLAISLEVYSINQRTIYWRQSEISPVSTAFVSVHGQKPLSLMHFLRPPPLHPKSCWYEICLQPKHKMKICHLCSQSY